MIRRVNRLPGRLLIMLVLLLGVLVAISVGIALFVGGSSSGQPQSFDSHVVVDVPRWIHQEHLPPAAFRGAERFAVSGCTACHTYDGSGRMNLNAPDLTTIGSRHLGMTFQIAHLKCPSRVNPGSPMPQFASLGNTRLHQLAVLVENSKGIQ
jgi:cbb3-type cytochrome oxidase cytochrome c subunit